jgi:predicted dehydrogenase
MSKNYRWGILGAGRIAEKFCTALCFVEGSEVYAVASRDMAKAKDYASKFNAAVFYNSYEELVKDENVDIIYIATPHAFHYDQAMLCLDNNKPVVCEKPMSLSHKQTSKMIAVATQKKLFLMEGMWTRFMPFLEKILSLIKEDLIGRPQYVNVDFGFTAPVDLNGRLYNKSLGGGSTLDIGVYCIFLATLLLGESPVIKTVAKIEETGVDGYANVIMQYGGGETAHILTSIIFNTALEAEIIGSKGRIKINSPWYKATEFSVHLVNDESESFSMPHASNGFEYEIREVMRCLDNGLLQSDKMPHKLTLSISKTMDEVLKQAGVSY